VNSESKANITCLVYSHDGSGEWPAGRAGRRSRPGLGRRRGQEGAGGTAGWPGTRGASGPGRGTTAACSLLTPVSSIPCQSCWPATTMRTFISSTPRTATGRSTSRDTRGIAIMPPVRAGWDGCGGRPPPGRPRSPLRGARRLSPGCRRAAATPVSPSPAACGARLAACTPGAVSVASPSLRLRPGGGAVWSWGAVPGATRKNNCLLLAYFCSSQCFHLPLKDP